MKDAPDTIAVDTGVVLDALLSDDPATIVQAEARLLDDIERGLLNAGDTRETSQPTDRNSDSDADM